MRPYTRPSQDICGFHGVKYGNIAPNVFVDNCELSPTADEINNLSLQDIYVYSEMRFDNWYANPAQCSPDVYLDTFADLKKGIEGKHHYIPYPPEYPGKWHRHEVNERELLWDFYIRARSIIANHAPDALRHFNPPCAHPRDLTYCTKGHNLSTNRVLSRYYKWFHYALCTVKASPYDEPWNNDPIRKDVFMYAKRNYTCVLLPPVFPRIPRMRNENKVPNEDHWREISAKYYGAEGSQARRNFIRHNRRMAGKYYDKDLSLLRMAVGMEVYRMGLKHQTYFYASRAANRYAHLLDHEVSTAGGYLTVGTIFDAADDATMEVGTFPYGDEAKFKNDDRFSVANQSVKDPERPWEIEKYQWVMGPDGNWKPRDKPPLCLERIPYMGPQR